MRTIFSRRDFLKTVGIGSAAFAAGRSWGVSRSSERPNILVIMSDEHNAGVMGCAGNAVIRTPHLDGLAQRGVVFENCYCNSPLCVPSRLSFTAGKYCSRVGAWSNDCWLPSEDYPSLARIMNAAGYESVLCGKMHYDRTRRYGFTEIGGNMNRHYKKGIGARRRADDLTPQPGISARFDEFHAGDTSPVIEHDIAVSAGVVKFLKKGRRNAKPFFLIAGFIAPHFPLIVPEAYWEPYRGKAPMPVIPEGFLDQLPLNYKHLRIGFNVEDVPEDIVRKSRELYYGFVQWVDDQIGQVLQALDDSAVADNTLVIYTTDHGENMGEHGLWWKNCLYESAAHVPLIVSWPARWTGGQRRTGACSLVDVVKTIAEIGGAQTPEDWNGDSLVAWLGDPAAPWKDRAVSEYYGHNIASGYAMIRMGAFKYVYHAPADADHPAFCELYDLAQDPGEFHNLAGDPAQAGRIKSMHATLVAEIGEEPELTEQRCRADYARGYGRPPEEKKKRDRKKAKPPRENAPDKTKRPADNE